MTQTCSFSSTLETQCPQIAQIAPEISIELALVARAQVFGISF
jgi:hypothetical protein